MRQDIEAAKKVMKALLRPPFSRDDESDRAEHFDPWELFPSVYGSYSSAFDELAIAVLTDIQNGTHDRDDLANEIFREMLCTADLCEYGGSPRSCYPTPAFRMLLSRLIERWKEYAAIKWESSEVLP